MPYCPKCGADVTGVRFCAKCGAPVPAAESEASTPTGNPPPGTSGGGGSYATPQTQGGMSDNMAGALAYLVIPAILFLVIDPFKGRRFVRFHSFQSLFFFAASWVLSIGLSLVASILSVVGVGFIIWMFWPILSLAIFVVWIILIVKAYQNQEYRLPVVGDLAAKQV